MVKWWRVVVAVGAVLGTANPGSAQTVDEQIPPLPARSVPAPLQAFLPAELRSDAEDAERRAELQRWMDEFSDWHEWSAKWRGRRQPGWLTGFRERRAKPSPPDWLPARCESLLDDADLEAQACALLAVWRDDGMAAQQIRQARAAAVTDREKATRTTWWENVHMDVMWPALQWQSSVYGVVGTHITTQVGGRLQVFTAPGAMLLNVPSRNGSRVWKVAANYGIGYRVMDFTFPGGRPAELHVNLAKMWLLSDAKDLMVGRTVDVIGFSMTFKRR
jgi:hypothetical protein